MTAVQGEEWETEKKDTRQRERKTRHEREKDGESSWPSAVHDAYLSRSCDFCSPLKRLARMCGNVDDMYKKGITLLFRAFSTF